jgi:hypothetical protein
MFSTTAGVADQTPNKFLVNTVPHAKGAVGLPLPVGATLESWQTLVVLLKEYVL